MIEHVCVIPAPQARVFDLELNVDIHAASLAASSETAITSTGRRTLGPGDEVTFRARHFGLPWRMTTRITAYEPPHRFVDEQTRGPFRSLHHEHLFEDLGNSTTRMTDRMTVTAPLGPLGALVTRLLLTPYLIHLLKQRAAHIRSVVVAESSRQVGG